MNIEKERLSDNFFLPKWIRMEHDARYFFASKFVSEKTVVDCACGTGTGTNIFLAAGAKSVSGFDASEKALQEAGEKCKNKNAAFKLSDALSLSVQDNTADTYISLETIEHIDRDHKFLKEVRRILKNDGTFVCSTPNRTVTNPGKKIAERPSNIFHIREYSKEEFFALLKKYFNEIEVFGQNPNGKLKVNLLNTLSKILPKNAVVKMHQALKLISFIAHSRKKSYEVVKIDPKFEYEYLIAVCRP